MRTAVTRSALTSPPSVYPVGSPAGSKTSRRGCSRSTAKLAGAVALQCVAACRGQAQYDCKRLGRLQLRESLEHLSRADLTPGPDGLLFDFAAFAQFLVREVDLHPGSGIRGILTPGVNPVKPGPLRLLAETRCLGRVTMGLHPDVLPGLRRAAERPRCRGRGARRGFGARSLRGSRSRRARDLPASRRRRARRRVSPSLPARTTPRRACSPPAFDDARVTQLTLEPGGSSPAASTSASRVSRLTRSVSAPVRALA